jgi:type IV pilus assembly protein PilC
MMHAGIPIIRIFEVLENQTENKSLRVVIATIARDIKTGATLYDALKKHPKIFSPLYLSMVKAGESSGTIVDVLDRLIKIIEHEAKVKSDIKSAMQYPIIVLIALGIAFFVLLTFVIPKFATMFAKVGLDLPLPTKIAMWLYSAISDYWAVTLSAVAGFIIGFRLWIKTVNGRFLLDTFFLKMPLFGPLFQKSAMSRFASIFSILQASGVPVMQALDILSGTIGNTAIAKEFEIVRDKISEGQGISGPLSKAKYFPPMVVDMIAIGEESGNIEDMLRQVSIHYDDEVDYAVKGLSDALGPILVVGLAAVVGFFALAIFLPMWDMTKMVK